MKAYKISCHSKCGSYFASYLQSVTVIANSQDEAISELRKWMRDNDRSFINNDEKVWQVELLSTVSIPGVLDWQEDSDY